MEIKHRTELSKLMPNRKLIGAEIGVASGLNSNDMLMNCDIKTLYLVDNWKCISNQKGDGSSPQSWHDFNYESTKRLMKNHKGNVFPIEKNTRCLHSPRQIKVRHNQANENTQANEYIVMSPKTVLRKSHGNPQDKGSNGPGEQGKVLATS